MQPTPQGLRGGRVPRSRHRIGQCCLFRSQRRVLWPRNDRPRVPLVSREQKWLLCWPAQGSDPSICLVEAAGTSTGLSWPKREEITMDAMPRPERFHPRAYNNALVHKTRPSCPLVSSSSLSLTCLLFIQQPRQSVATFNRSSFAAIKAMREYHGFSWW